MPRVSVEYRTSSKAAYDKFIADNPTLSISFEKWKEVIYTFNELFRDYVLESGEKAKLPFGLGSFAISKKKPKRYKTHEGKEYINLPVDWAKTRKAGKKIYHLNTHTDGCRFKWFWFPTESRIYQVHIWNFKPSRTSSRKIKEYLTKPNSNFSQLYKSWERR